jgi:hypothetical protein
MAQWRVLGEAFTNQLGHMLHLRSHCNIIFTLQLDLTEKI